MPSRYVGPEKWKGVDCWAVWCGLVSNWYTISTFRADLVIAIVGPPKASADYREYPIRQANYSYLW